MRRNHVSVISTSGRALLGLLIAAGIPAPALADFNQAIVANPKHAPAYLGRANLLRSQGHLPEALADLNQAIALNPEGAQAFHARGLTDRGARCKTLLSAAKDSRQMRAANLRCKCSEKRGIS